MVETDKETIQESTAKILCALEMLGYIPPLAEEAKEEEEIEEPLKALKYA